MRKQRQVGAALLAAVLVGAVAPARPAAAAPPEPPAGSELVLITGDRVALGASGAVSVEPGADRTGIGFSTFRDARGHVHVVPSDAERLLAAGTVDAGLFDVTALAAYGYDGGRGGTPLIVRYGKRGGAPAKSRITRGGARVARELPSVDGAAVEARHATTATLWTELTSGLRTDIEGVSLDRKLSLNLDTSTTQVGAPVAWAAGFDGTGTRVAVLDTGIDATHPDLAGKVVAEHNFTTEADQDLVGHGTHVASTVAGTGAASEGRYRGVAPGAQLLDGKVCIVAPSDNCQESAIVAAMQWAVDQGADVVNLSLGGGDTAGVDPMEEAVNTLSAEHGTLFVISAGNSGPGDMTVESPSTADAALSVGAVTDTDELTGFSSHGPRIGDTALKPEITAPGQGITAAASSTAVNLPPGTVYTTMDGTSMASPHVAGAAAILAQRHPDWSGARIKAALLGSARPQEQTPIFGQGAGRLDIGRGYAQTVLADPPVLNLGRQQHPHDDDPVLDRTLTYLNTGTAALTLQLSLTGRGPAGAAAPAGMFALGASSVTVPAGGTASVGFRADTTVDGPEGAYGGTVVATGPDGVRIGTPFAVDRAIAGGEVTLHHLDSAGRPATSRSTMLFSLDGGEDYYLGNESEPMTKFIRQGRYFAQSRISDPTGPGAQDTVLVDPELRIDGNTEVTFDARAARTVRADVTDDPLEKPLSVELGYSWPEGDGHREYWTHLFDASRPFAFGQVDPDESTTGLTGYLAIALARPGPDPADPFYGSPRSYHLVDRFTGRIPTGFTGTWTTAGLARVENRLGASTPGTEGRKATYAYVGTPWPANSFEIRGDLPMRHTEFFTPGTWSSSFLDWHAPARVPTIRLEGPPRTLAAGTTVTERWNEPVLGPSYAALAQPTDGVLRTGDTLHLDPRMIGDGAGHSDYGFTPQYTLRRAGTVIASSTEGPWGDVTVPAREATYRLDGTLDRPAPAELSTRVTASWTFRSGTATGRLPLWTATVRPDLDATGTAKAGGPFSFPVTAEAQPGSAPGRVSSVTVKYSTDDGTSWRNATTTGTGARRTATVRHPGTAGFVSLRITVADSDGNAVQQTVLRAYRIG